MFKKRMRISNDDNVISHNFNYPRFGRFDAGRSSGITQSVISCEIATVKWCG